MSIKPSRRSSCQHGLTLIELIIFIVILSVALVALLRVLNMTAQHSSDPMITKQLQAIAEAYLEEVTAMPYTLCDPADPNAATATSTANCTAGLSEATTGPKTIPATLPNPGTETRTGTPQFNNVGNYAGFVSASAFDMGGTLTTTFSTTSSCTPAVKIGVTFDGAADLGPASQLVPATAALHIVVNVTCGQNGVTLEGYRAQYAPNMGP